MTKRIEGQPAALGGGGVAQLLCDPTTGDFVEDDRDHQRDDPHGGAVDDVVAVYGWDIACRRRGPQRGAVCLSSLRRADPRQEGRPLCQSAVCAWQTDYNRASAQQPWQHGTRRVYEPLPPRHVDTEPRYQRLDNGEQVRLRCHQPSLRAHFTCSVPVGVSKDTLCVY